MNNNKEKILQALDHFFESGDKQILKIIDKENNFDLQVCSDYFYEHKKQLQNKSSKTAEIISLLFNNEDKVLSIKQFIEKTLNGRIAGIFANDVSLSGAIKNLYMYELIEKIRFSKMQKESLRDTTSYNRHIEKALTEMRDALLILFELGISYDEIYPVLDKYFEFNRGVNTLKCWQEFNSLYEYPQFKHFLASKEDELLHFYLNTSLHPESIKVMIENNNAKAIEAVKQKSNDKEDIDL